MGMVVIPLYKPDLKTLLVPSCGIPAGLEFPGQKWVSHLLDQPGEGEVQSHCIFFKLQNSD